MLLKKYNINSHIAMNGKEAVDAVSTRGVDKYDMIFMDYSMPVMVSTEYINLYYLIYTVVFLC